MLTHNLGGQFDWRRFQGHGQGRTPCTQSTGSSQHNEPILRGGAHLILGDYLLASVSDSICCILDRGGQDGKRVTVTNSVRVSNKTSDDVYTHGFVCLTVMSLASFHSFEVYSIRAAASSSLNSKSLFTVT